MIEYQDLILNNSQYNQLILSNQNCNSFLFESKDEIFLTNFCYCFAKYLLCSSNKKPCNVCQNCQKVELLSHSDLIIYPKNNKKSILVDDIKSLIEQVYLSPIESDKKVFVLNDFSLATIQAQNKLLKILEEPPKNVFFIIGATNISKVLPTIISRCKRTRLLALSDEEIKEAIKGCQNIDSIIDLAGGELTKAVKYSLDKNFIEIYEQVISTLQDMKDSRQLIKYSSLLLSKRENFSVILTIFESFFRDILLIRLNKSCLIKNKNIYKTLENLAKDYNADGVDKIIKRIYTISKQLEANCNPTYLLDNLLLYILEVKYLCKK